MVGLVELAGYPVQGSLDAMAGVADPGVVGGRDAGVDLSDAGALASAGTALIEPLHRLAAWIGPAASAISAILG